MASISFCAIIPCLLLQWGWALSGLQGPCGALLRSVQHGSHVVGGTDSEPSRPKDHREASVTMISFISSACWVNSKSLSTTQGSLRSVFSHVFLCICSDPPFPAGPFASLTQLRTLPPPGDLSSPLGSYLHTNAEVKINHLLITYRKNNPCE